jgi:hypothetical protein
MWKKRKDWKNIFLGKIWNYYYSILLAVWFLFQPFKNFKEIAVVWS